MTTPSPLTQALDSLEQSKGILERLVALADTTDDGDLWLRADSQLVADAREALLIAQLVLSLHAKRESVAKRVGDAGLVAACEDILLAPWRRA